MKNHFTRHLFCLATSSAMLSTAAMATITNFTSWTLTQDPAHVLFGGSNTLNDATLTAGNGTIPAGTDVGFASVNGSTVMSSTSGSYFSSAASFSLAINYNLTAAFPVGFSTSGIFIGFGIGEDIGGVDSAGVTLGVLNFGALPILSLAATARVNDVTQPVGSVAGTAASAGTFFVSYDEPTGNIVVGAANIQDAAAPTGSHTFVGVANSWDDENLLASFFMRSDNPSGFPLWNGNSASAVFSNVRVLNGSPTVIPEPATAVILAFGSLGIFLRRNAARS